MKHSLMRNSLAVSFASGLSVLTSVASTVLIAGTYGLSASSDAYFVAIVLSNLTSMILQVSVGSVLVPAVAQAAVKGSSPAGERLVQSLLAGGTSIGLLVYALLAIVASPIMYILAPGFDGETAQVAAHLFRFASVGVALAFPSEVLRAYLNIKGVFGWPAAAEAIRTGAIVVGILILQTSWGIDAAIIGYSVGHILQFLFLLILAIAKGLPARPVLDLHDPQLRIFLRELRFPIVGVSVNFAPLLLQRFLASLLPAGAVAVFSIAQQIVFMLFAVTLKAVSTATHPVVSRHAAEDDSDSMNTALVRGLKLSALLGSAAFVLVAALNRDMVALIAGFRSFTHEDAAALSLILLVLTAMLPVNGLAQVLRLPFYAHGNARVPAWHMAGMGMVHAVAQVLLFYSFGLIGIAWAQVFWVWLTMATCLMLLPAGSKVVAPKAIPSLGRLVLSTMALGLALYVCSDMIIPLQADASRVLRLLRIGALGFATATLLAILFRIVSMADYADVLGVRGYRALAARVLQQMPR